MKIGQSEPDLQPIRNLRQAPRDRTGASSPRAAGRSTRPSSGPDRRQGPGLHRGKEAPGRHRGHAVEGRPRQRPAPQPLRRFGQDPPPAGPHGGCDQARPHRRLDRRTDARSNPEIRLRPPRDNPNLNPRIRQQYPNRGNFSPNLNIAAAVSRIDGRSGATAQRLLPRISWFRASALAPSVRQVLGL